MRKAVRAFSGAMLVLATVTACNDDPLSENRDQGSYFMLNPVVAVVDAGDSTTVTAIVMNEHGAPIGAAVTAEPCDAKISVDADPTRSAFEEPERFVVRGATLGETCLVVRGGGVTDTATIRVVPASVVVSGVDTLASGSTGQATVSFRNAAGAAVTGFTAANYAWTSLNTTIATVSNTGTVTAFAPGTGRIVVTTLGNTGAVRADTIEVVVRAGQFTGTFTPTNPTEGSIMTINASSGIEFDSDTQVLVGGVTWPWVLSRSASTIRMATPNTGSIVISNIGAGQVSLNATIPVVSHEPDDGDLTTRRVLAENDTMFFFVGGSDDLDLARIVVPAGGGTYRFGLDWNPNAPARDLDIVFFNDQGDFMGYGAPWGGCATGSRPEGCTVPLPAGTWYPAVNLYEGDPTTARLIITKQ